MTNRAPDQDQPTLPGTIPTPSAALIELAEKFEKTRDARLQYAKDEQEQEAKVLAIMKEEHVELLTTSSGRNLNITHGKEKLSFSTPKEE